MIDIQRLIESLHPLERKILPFLQKNKDLGSLEKESGFKEVEIMRALQWLENKKALKIKTSTKAIISLDENGILYKRLGLPEIRFLNSLDTPRTSKELKEKANLDDDELTIGIGILKKKGLINLQEKISITDQGKAYLKKQSLEEQFLNLLPLTTSELKDEQKYAYQELSKRKKIIKTDLKKLREIQLTELGEKLAKTKISADYIEALTPQIIRSGSWKNQKFRRYDINSIAPRIYPGKIHPINQAIEYIRRIWLDLGFQEMNGTIIQSAFWNLDALFVPQDHPARELQDTLYLKGSVKELPLELVKKVKETHETGWTTGSTGWNYKWDENIAKQLLLRTHTTPLSAQTISKLKESDLPVKFFNIGKVFRNETLDWSHLFEFNQSEGIVIDENVNFRHLLGYLREFFKKMGFERVRFRPAYFPYTELSVEPEVFHPIHKKWIELGGAGIFRPEVVKPLLGKDIPVLAWGLGVERIITLDYKINDLRDLYKNDIKKLREFPIFLK